MIEKRLMVTGCGGFVAGGIVHQAGDAWELHALSRQAPLLDRPGLVWHSFDLLDNDRLHDTFHAIKPDAVIHAAALADIDFCQAHQELARGVNAGVTGELAGLCADSGAKLVFLSTDNIYDGERGYYTEEDPPTPINFYGKTKVMAEEAVAALRVSYAVARVSLVMGLPMLGAGNSFLSRMMPILERGEELGVPDNEIRSPVDVVTAARALLELAGNDYDGYLQVAGNDVCNRFEMARRIARKFGHPEKLVAPRDPVDIPGRAPRPLNASLCNHKARDVLGAPMLGIEDGLELVLAAAGRGAS